MTDEDLMRLALGQAEGALQTGEPPFGAIVATLGGEVLASARDMVRTLRDWTRHAEVEAVRAACRDYGADLHHCQLITTVEPCPMCFTSAWLGKIPRIVYGATMEEVAAVTKGAQRELSIPAEKINELSPGPLTLIGGILREECLALFHDPRAFAQASS